MTSENLTIAEFAARTGVPAGTLRMWERRYAFPAPPRSGRGHRLYREADVDLVRRVASERSTGLSLAAAIARAQNNARAPAPSVYAALRSHHPELEPRTMRKPLLMALTKAIEDESLSRAEKPLLFASFQREDAYRRQQARWRELSWGARCSVVFADFERVQAPADGPVEIPVALTHPLAREWTLVCCATSHAACLSAWEPPTDGGVSERDRVFEAVWSVEADVVWEAARVCAGIATESAPADLRPIADELERDPEPRQADQLRLAAAVTARLLAHLS